MYQLKLILSLISILCLQQLKGQKLPQIEVDALDFGRKNTPVYVSTSKNLSIDGYQLRNVKTGRVSDVQSIGPGQFLFVLPDSLEPHEVATYKFIKTSAKKKQPVRIEKSDDGLQVTIKDKPLLFYHTKREQPPAGNPEYYGRSGFIHPLRTPRGIIVTDDFPIGHVHQHGIMSAWVNTKFKNTAVDFWNQHLRTGDVVHKDLVHFESGAVAGVLQVNLSHVSKEHGQVLEELWTITVYPFEDYFLFDLKSEQSNTSKDTLFLNKYHYGGFAFRGAKQWSPDDSAAFQNRWQIETDSLYNLKNANGKHVSFVNTSGMINGETVGVTVLGFPDNIRYPQAIRVHPTMPYWAYTPVVDGPLTIAPGQTVKAAYRYYVYDGDTGRARNKTLLTDLTHPVRVTLK